MTERWRIRVRGIVQGVGFRPFVYRLAVKLGLDGWVLNDNEGVLIEIEGAPVFLHSFLECLEDEVPAAARIREIEYSVVAVSGESGFAVRKSPQSVFSERALISPDLAICDKCRAEIFDKGNRRYGYVFTNCTDCGPRYSITHGAPYDRIRTSMERFRLCNDCKDEYSTPADRRFHAEPNCCAECGPALEYVSALPAGEMSTEQILAQVRSDVGQGKIVAVKGVSGFHLIADAMNEEAVLRLRERKRRETKPFAVMAGSIERVREFADVSAAEERMLQSSAAPIVLLKKKESILAASIAPMNAYIGVMLPYAPLEALLLSPDDVWIMTSGNATGEPQIFDNDEALEKLGGVADAFLLNNRDIVNATDDSLVRIAGDKKMVLRRGRGIAPEPLEIAGEGDVLAAGAELKSAFCFAQKEKAFLSEHIGDLKNKAVFDMYRKKIACYQELFDLAPKVFAVDLHPDYLSAQYVSRLAKEQGRPLIKVQHHHAHIASVLAEHGENGTVIGLAFDGTGYGADGNIWGGEFLLADMGRYERVAHFSYLPLPGGEKAAKEPWRQALWVLYGIYGDKLAEKRTDFGRYWENSGRLLIDAVRQGINSPFSSSVGRLFDTAAALLGVRYVNSYEGEAASELEQLALTADSEELMPYEIYEHSDIIEIDFLPLLEMLALRYDGKNTPYLARCFHLTLATAAAEVVTRLSERFGVNKVALSGGVFQNMLLTELICSNLNGFDILMNRDVPLNDGGIAYGQAAVARTIGNRG